MLRLSVRTAASFSGVIALRYQGAKYLMFMAAYGEGRIFVNAPTTFDLPANACPSYDVIAAGRNQPNCTLRAGSFLDYRW